MKIVILCGGIGSRMENYSLPKPLNMIYGRYSISYTLQHIPHYIKELYFVYNSYLEKYNFKEIIINIFKNRVCHFFKVDYLTRGPVETAFVGTSTFSESDGSVVFIDNDNIYHFPTDFFNDKQNNFIGVSVDRTNKESYSFVSHENDKLIDILEKKRISDTYCCGVYGFKNISEFRKYSTKLLEFTNHRDHNELYMSDIYRLMLANREFIDIIHFKNQVNHIGTLTEVRNSIDKIPVNKLRICFDLDNTLVTYPSVIGDYSTVNPINNAINIVKKLHNQGHTIIIYTARRMTTHKNNIGAVIKDIGKITFETLENFDIPYDELIFGKPIADIYVDDRSVNPYLMNYSSMGLFGIDNDSELINNLPTNKLNSITKYGNHLIKKGPSEFMNGEWYSYNKINDYSIKHFFPEVFSFKTLNNTSELELEYIKGITFYTLFKHEVLTEKYIKELLNIVNIFHNIVDDITINEDIIINSYITKLEDRFSKLDDYPFENSKVLLDKILESLRAYRVLKIVPFIHGDLWFSNIMLTFDNKIKCFDMKGRVGNNLTTNGDTMYDYAKIYQSILGFDESLYGDTIDSKYKKNIQNTFEDYITQRGISLDNLKILTVSLISGTFHAIETYEAKLRVWDLLNKLI